MEERINAEWRGAEGVFFEPPNGAFTKCRKLCAPLRPQRLCVFSEPFWTESFRLRQFQTLVVAVSRRNFFGEQQPRQE